MKVRAFNWNIADSESEGEGNSPKNTKAVKTNTKPIKPVNLDRVSQ